MPVRSHAPTQGVVFHEQGSKCGRKEPVVPLETGMSWENFYKLLRLCLLVARKTRGAERSQPVSSCRLTGLRVHMFGEAYPLASWPWSGCPGYLPDSCFAVLRGQRGRSEAQPGKGSLGTCLIWVGLEATETKTAVGGGGPLGSELLDASPA